MKRRHTRTRLFARQLGAERLEMRLLLAADLVACADPISLGDAERELAATYGYADMPALRSSVGGRFYYLDTAFAEAAADPVETAATQTSGDGPKVPLDALPQLQSDPQSANTFFLDFDGQIVSGTDWNVSDHRGRDIHAAPYDLDGDRTTFSEEEVAAITEIWRRVSEDFLPFDMNITTVEPPASAFASGKGAIRAIITTNLDDKEMGGTGEEWFKDAGGVAYIGSWLTRGDMPVWVFQNKLPKTVKAVAEAASHEFGHALGLSHDGGGGSAYYNGHGSGEASWAPIMGAGYSKNVTQWSKGDYPGATNAERDLDIITNTFNKVSLRDDDHGNWEPDASPLTRVGNQVFGQGLIGDNTDIDFFSFDHPGGQVTIQVAPAELGANLDVVAGLYDDDRNELIVLEPSPALDANISIELEPGRYYLFVEGGGNRPEDGSPGYDDYGSLGQYSVSGYLGPAKLTANPGGNDGNGVCTNCSDQEYTIDEGQALVLNGSQSLGAGSPLTYEWDVDGDGAYDDAVGEVVTLTWEQLTHLEKPIRDDGVYQVSLRVRDAQGDMDENSAVLRVINRPPEVRFEPADHPLFAGNVIPLQLVASDIAADPLTFTWDFGDGNRQTTSTPRASHVFDVGTFEVTVTVSDDEGGDTQIGMPLDIKLDVPRLLGTSVPRANAVIPADTVRVAFSQDVSASLNPSDLYLFDQVKNTIVNPPRPSVTWIAASNTAEFSIRGVAHGNYLVVINGSGIYNAEGTALDGDNNGTAGGNWSVHVAVTLPGDLNLDQRVNFDDFLAFSQAFGSSPAQWEDGDFDGDGLVSFSDFLLLSHNFSDNA